MKIGLLDRSRPVTKDSTGRVRTPKADMEDLVLWCLGIRGFGWYIYPESINCIPFDRIICNHASCLQRDFYHRDRAFPSLAPNAAQSNHVSNHLIMYLVYATL